MLTGILAIVTIFALTPSSGLSQDSRAVRGRSAVWVALEDAGRLAKVNLDAGRTVRRVNVPGRPHNLTVSRNGTVITTLQGRGSVAIVRGRRVKEVSLGGSPHDVKIVHRIAVVTNEGAARLDRITLRGKCRKAIPLRADPHDLAITPNGRRAWVTMDGTDDIAIVDLKRARVRRYLSTGKSPHDVLFAPDGQAWVTDWVQGIHVFERNGRIVKTFDRGVEPHHLAFTPNGRQVWITDNGAMRVLIVSARTLRVLAVRPVRGAPHHVAITADGRRVAVADNDRGKIVVFNASTRKKLRGVSVGAGPHGVWSVP